MINEKDCDTCKHDGNCALQHTSAPSDLSCHEICNFCNITDVAISQGFRTSTGRVAFADLRFDSENNQLEINYGLLEFGGYQGWDSTWSDSLDINFCPMCGRRLRNN